MKKVIAIAGVIILCGIFSAVLCTRASMEKSVTEQSEESKYATEVIAKKTIEHYIESIVTVDEKNVNAKVDNYLLPDTNGNNDYLYVSVKNIQTDNYRVLFLYNGDRSLVEAEESKRSFVNEKMEIDLAYKEEQYHSASNSGKGAFAYTYKDNDRNEIAVILTEESEFQLSSIWALNGDVATLVWHNDIEE